MLDMVMAVNSAKTGSHIFHLLLDFKYKVRLNAKNNA